MLWKIVSSGPSNVVEELPLKQGLKQRLTERDEYGNAVVEELPLKQGLKLYI